MHQFVEDALGDGLHAQRVFSLANGVLRVLNAASLAIHAIGQGLSVALGLDPKHAVKQVGRLLSNAGVDVEDLAPYWVVFVIASRTDVVVAMDQTDSDDDDQTTLVLNVIADHGRATPLRWKTVPEKGLEARCVDHEEDLLERLREAVPDAVRVTVMADRGFGDQKLYTFLRELGLHDVIRFRGTSRSPRPAARHFPRRSGCVWMVAS